MSMVGKVKDSAEKAACCSNLRQLGMATIAFVGDNGDVMPPGGRANLAAAGVIADISMSSRMNWTLIGMLLNYCEIGASFRNAVVLNDNSAANITATYAALNELHRTIARCPANRQASRAIRSTATGNWTNHLDYGLQAYSGANWRATLALWSRAAGKLRYGPSNVPMWSDLALAERGSLSLRINHFRRHLTGNVPDTGVATVQTVAGCNRVGLDGSVRWMKATGSGTSVQGTAREFGPITNNASIGGDGFLPTTVIRVWLEDSGSGNILPDPNPIRRWTGSGFNNTSLSGTF